MNRAAKCLLVTLLGMSALSCREDEIVITINVDSEQKISETHGNFEGELTANSQFGSAVAVIGDLEADGVGDLVVGAPFQDNGGAVWVLFMDKDGTVDLETKIADSEGGFRGNLDDKDAFGSAVAGIGDLDGDGINDIAVGAPLDDDGGNDRGAVWILFLKADGKVKSHQKISDDAGKFRVELENNDQFGTALATLGDLDGDGITDLAVGAPFANNLRIETGAVWILFMDTDGTVKSHRRISGRTGSLNDPLASGNLFGRSLANMGDLNKDGVTDLAVGSPGDDDGGLDRGVIWVLYLNTDGTVSREEKISVTESSFVLPIEDGDHFGEVIANAGDINEDGVTDLAEGIPFDDDGATDSGAVFILFINSDSEVLDLQKLSNTQGIFNGILNSDDHFGAAIAGIGDLNNRRGVDLAVGAPLDNDGGLNKGAFWILFMDEADTRTECERSALLRFLGIGNCQ
ncbi:MAG: integrin alpha [Gammaproteobacteria bacterium]|nr:integrin alpha [Gammaproteobacteria bacterium]